MKLAMSIVAFILAVGFGVFLMMALRQTEVQINTEKAQGVYNIETKEFSGTLSGWSSSGGFGGAFEEIQEAAEKTIGRNIAIRAGGAGVFLLIGVLTLIGWIRDRKRHRMASSRNEA